MKNRKKLILCALFFISFCLLPACSMAQTVTKTFKHETLKNVLKEVERQTGLSVIYKVDEVNESKTITSSFKNTPIRVVLSKILDNDLEYLIQDKMIVIQKKGTRATSQNKYTGKTIPISGVITDVNGQPIIGASIRLKGQKVGAISDVSGKFNIQVPEDGILEITYVGYQDQLVSVKGKHNFNITLRDNAKLLNEVVVVGYGTTSRKNLTTSISSIKPEGISKAAVSNMSSLLLGRASGLQATIDSPQPDGKVNVSIRGGGTPLYVIDGIVMPSDALEVGSGNTSLPSSINRSGIGGLNPDDIESIEILKDASAAIYGIGAANGVILITTKKGKQGRTNITYTGSYSIIQNQRQIEILNADQYMRVANAYNKDQYLYNHSMTPYGNNPYDGLWTPVYSNEKIASNTINTNWPDLVMRDGKINNHNITISGGSESLQYYLGLNYYDQDATVKNSSMQRYIIRSNVSAKLFPFLKLGTTLNYNKNNYTNSTVGNDTSGGHTYGAYQAAISYPPILGIKDEGVYTSFSNIPNPKALLDIDDKTETNTIYANFTVDVDIIKDMLSAKLIYGMNKEATNRKLYIPSDVYYNQLLRSRGDIGNANRTRQTMEATVNFRKDFSKIVDVEIVAGMGRYLYSYDGSNIYYENTNDLIGNDNIGLAEGPYTPSSYKGKNEKRSQFVRGSFNFLDRYILTATLRRDGTDKFFPSKKYALFPSVALAWKITNEQFMKKVPFVNLLKLRVSYGKTGLDNLGSSLYGLYTSNSFIKFDNGSTAYMTYLLSGRDYDDVSWEKTIMKNIGLDFSLFNDRVWGSIDFYRNDETNLLTYDNESWLSMYGNRPVNGGHYKRTGFDISINTKNIETKDFKWVSIINISHNENLWVKRADNYDYQIFQKHKNEPYSSYYHYKYTGIINSEKSNMPNSQKSLSASWQMPGCPILKDKNGDGVINEEDIYLSNDGDPKIYAGFGNTFTYKNFDLDIFMYGRFGIHKWNRGLSYGQASSIVLLSRNVGISVFDQYNSLTNPNGKRVGYAYDNTSSLPSGKGPNLDVEDASFLRVRNITIGYNFTPKTLGGLAKFIHNARIYCDVQNPFIFTNYSMIDPEVISGGGQSSYTSFPQTRTYSFGVKVTF